LGSRMKKNNTKLKPENILWENFGGTMRWAWGGILIVFALGMTLLKYYVQFESFY